jgi:hypothetical protein
MTQFWSFFPLPPADLPERGELERLRVGRDDDRGVRELRV